MKNRQNLIISNRVNPMLLIKNQQKLIKNREPHPIRNRSNFSLIFV
eukprot:UN19123